MGPCRNGLRGCGFDGGEGAPCSKSLTGAFLGLPARPDTEGFRLWSYKHTPEICWLDRAFLEGLTGGMGWDMRGRGVKAGSTLLH